VVGAPDQPGEHYPLPASLEGEGLVFSPEFKRRSVGRISRLLQVALLLTPTLTAAAVWWGGLEGTARWAVLAAGAVLTPAVLITLYNYLPLWGYADVRRRLGARLRAEGFDVDAGLFVSFAPDSAPRLYEGGYTNWDFGYLILLGDRLCYVGEQTRFSLGRDQLTDLRLGPGMSRWWTVPHLYVSWADAAGAAGTFNIRAGEVHSMRELRRATVDLEQRLRRWQEQPAVEGDVPPQLAGLSTPAVGAVTSASPAALIRLSRLVFQTWFVFLLGSAVSLLLGLPFHPEDGGLGWYVPAVAVLTVWFDSIPLWRNRTTGRKETSAQKAPRAAAQGERPLEEVKAPAE
jgi:hypothetical protein